MSVSGLPRTLIARWYLTLIGVVVTVGLVVVAAIAVPVSYQAKASVVLIPPANATSNGGNPLLGLTGLQSAADVLARVMVDPVEVNRLKQQGVTNKYTVARDLTTDGPVLLVTVDGADSAGVLGELKMILADMPSTLALLQQSLTGKSDQIGLIPVNTADKPTSDRKSQLRAVIVAAVIGLMLTILIVNVGDRLLLRHRRRRVEAQQRAAVTDSPLEDETAPLPTVAPVTAPASPPPAAPAPVVVPGPASEPEPVEVQASLEQASAESPIPTNGRAPVGPHWPDRHVVEPGRSPAARINGAETNGHATDHSREMDSDLVLAAAPSSSAAPRSTDATGGTHTPNPDSASARRRMRRIYRSRRTD